MEEIRLTYGKYTWLPEALVQNAIDQKWERSLAIFILLRKTYRKPIFYDFTYKSLSAKTNISSSTLQRHIKKLSDLGLVRLHKNNLCLIGSDKLRKSLDSPLIAIKTETDKTKQILNIQFTRLLKNFRQQHYIARLKAETIKLQEDRKYIPNVKAIIKKRNTYLTQNEKLEDNYCISNKGLANLINRRSTTTGNKVQRALNEIGMKRF